jgi:hypothetical protein
MVAKQSERGQVLVLVILAIVVIMGFAALSVDMGRVYSTKRQAQNAADAAAMAAASARATSGGNPVASALLQLAFNDFGQDKDVHVNADKAQDIQVWNPPISGPYAAVDNKNEYYQVIIHVKVDKVFSQFVFVGNEEFSVEAVSHVKGSSAASPGAALHAIGRDVCPGLVFNGGSNTHILGGDIRSNSNGADHSGSCASGLMTGSSGTIKLDDGTLNVAGSWISNAGALISPAPNDNVPPTYPADMPVPSCAGLPTRNGNDNPLLPGHYPGGIVIQNGTVKMQPGFYCIDGNFTVNGGSLKGNGVVIYMSESGGGVNFSGSALVWLSTGSKIKDGAGKNFGGLLIYMDKNNHNGVDMAGSNGTYYHGTIYAPGYRDPASQEKCNIGGSNTSVSLRSNVICYSIGIAGNSSVTIDYRPNENYRMPPTIELAQ